MNRCKKTQDPLSKISDLQPGTVPQAAIKTVNPAGAFATVSNSPIEKAYLAGVLVLIGFDYPVGTYTLDALIIVIPLIVLGCYLCRLQG